MSRTSAVRTIAAPAEKVFEVVALIENFSQAVPHITNVEFLTEAHSGVGTRFRETRTVRGREATTELTVAEYVPPERVRMVSDAGGTIWDTLFTVTPQGESCDLTMVMDAKPYKLLARIATPLIMRTVGKAVAADMDAIKVFCESP